MRKTLLVAADVDRSLIDRAMDDGRFEVLWRPMRSEEELAANVAEAHILVTRAYSRVTRRVLDAAPRLELIAQGTSGIDNIDADAARERGIAIVSLPGANANAVAELVIAFMLSMTRTIPQYTREVARGVFSRDDCATRHELRYYALGIAGLGQVGVRVARLAHAFGMKVRAYDPYLIDSDFLDRGAERVRTLPELLAASDILTVHVPLNAETRGIIGESEIRALRPGSFLINAARGGVLDQRAALAALQDGHLGGIALDVFDPEPPVEALPDDARLILTPHVAGCTFECRSEIGAMLYEKIVAHYS